MKDIYLTNYSVKGIKTLDKTVSLSFYKKTINKEPDTQEYNIKGIYGMNGSGKSGIVTSVEILRNLIIDTGYLNNPVAQKHLDAIVNKKVGELSIEAEFIAKSGAQLLLFQYGITLSKNKAGKFTISHECLKEKMRHQRTVLWKSFMKSVMVKSFLCMVWRKKMVLWLKLEIRR